MGRQPRQGGSQDVRVQRADAPHLVKQQQRGLIVPAQEHHAPHLQQGNKTFYDKRTTALLSHADLVMCCAAACPLLDNICGIGTDSH